MTRILFAVLLGIPLWTGTAGSATFAGANFPDTFAVDGQTLALNGMGLRTLTILNIRVYVAGLYVAQRSRDAAQILASATPKVLLLQFLRSGSKSEVQHQFHEGETTNCGGGGCDPADQADYDRIVAAAPAVSEGDTFTFVLTSHGVRFFANNRLLAQSDRPDLGRLILLGFIGSHPPSQDLRAHLLGQGG